MIPLLTLHPVGEAAASAILSSIWHNMIPWAVVHFVASPVWVEKKKATVNIKNPDNLCFLYSVLAVSHPPKFKPNRYTPYVKLLKELTYDDFSFPITIDQIPRFEDLNTNYAINVIYPCCEDKTFIPIYASKHRNRKHIVNLLLLDRSEKRHYVVIRDLSRLLASRNSHNGRTFPCPYCLHCF